MYSRFSDLKFSPSNNHDAQNLRSVLLLFSLGKLINLFWKFKLNPVIYEKLKELIWPLVTWFMWTEVIQEHTLAKLIKFDFNEIIHFLPSSFGDVGFATNGVF